MVIKQIDWSEADGQQGLFDGEESKSRKTAGMKLAAENCPTNLEKARTIAIRIALRKGTVTADDVGQAMFDKYGIRSLGPSAGAIFRGGAFEFTGVRILSTRKKNNARELKVWRLTNAGLYQSKPLLPL